ncbi:hypothetical protein E2C01_094732 [Portunus trituberculatus]|uniref:Uncharacterized protein n=1 Tax=Portunus trituberculatus TaxID=210409 RepID=A0A5B7JXN7_PORTR|nr:hypothetical protein [Portunus trituberculatus]
MSPGDACAEQIFGQLARQGSSSAQSLRAADNGHPGHLPQRRTCSRVFSPPRSSCRRLMFRSHGPLSPLHHHQSSSSSLITLPVSLCNFLKTLPSHYNAPTSSSIPCPFPTSPDTPHRPYPFPVTLPHRATPPSPLPGTPHLLLGTLTPSQSLVTPS